MAAANPHDLFVLPVDSIKDSTDVRASVHFESGHSTYSSSSKLPLSSLGLTEGSFIYGSHISLHSHLNGWTAINCSNMLELSSNCASRRPSTSNNAQETNSTSNDSILIIMVPNDLIPNVKACQSMFKAISYKYLASQELEDFTKEHNGENTDLSASSSSWASSVSSSTATDGVQVIGAMGGKGIEFHKPRALKSGNLLLAPAKTSLFQYYPHISLANMAIDCFASDDAPSMSLIGLQTLDLSSNFFSSWTRHVGPILTGSHDLTTINLSGNPIQSLKSEKDQLEGQIQRIANDVVSWLSSQPDFGESVIRIFKVDANSHLARETRVDIPPSVVSPFTISCPSLTTLVLNKTGISWMTFSVIVSSLPSLAEAHACFNNWTYLSPVDVCVDGRSLGSPSLRSLNLDSNQLTDFTNVALAMTNFPNLAKLVLSNNPILSIPSGLVLAPTHPFSRTQLEGQDATSWSISLSSTRISDWASLKNLSTLVPLLTEIRWQRNKMFKLASGVTTNNASNAASASNQGSAVSHVSDQVARQYVIAMCPNVTMVNGSAVSDLEHRDAERLYLVHYFGTIPSHRVPASLKDPSPFIDELAVEDTTLKSIWALQKEATIEAFSRAFSLASGSDGTSVNSGSISMMDVYISDETGGLYIQKKLPASTTIAKLRAIISAAIPGTPVQDTLRDFTISLMETSHSGPPSFVLLTNEASTLAQETPKFNVGLLVKPRK